MSKKEGILSSFLGRGKEEDKKPGEQPVAQTPPPAPPENPATRSGGAGSVTPPPKKTEPAMEPISPIGTGWKQPGGPGAAATPDAASTRLTKDIAFKGELRGTGSVEIDGRFEGSIVLDHKVTILTNGDVQASVRAEEVVVEGKLVGDVVASKRITINKKGCMLGNIKATRVIVSEGASFKGNVDMEVEEGAARPEPAAKAPAPKPAHPAQPAQPARPPEAPKTGEPRR